MIDGLRMGRCIGISDAPAEELRAQLDELDAWVDDRAREEVRRSRPVA